MYFDSDIERIYEEAHFRSDYEIGYGYAYKHSPPLSKILPNKNISWFWKNQVFIKSFKELCFNILDLEETLDGLEHTDLVRKELESDLVEYKNQLVDLKIHTMKEINKPQYSIEYRLNELENQQQIMSNYIHIQYPSLFIRDYKNHSYETFMNHFNMIYGFGCIQSIKIVSRKNPKNSKKYQLIFVHFKLFYPFLSTYQRRKAITELMEQIEIQGKSNIYDIYGNYFCTARKYISKN